MPFPLSLLDPTPVDVPVRQTTAQQEADLEKIIAHFNKPGYDLPVGETTPSSPLKDDGGKGGAGAKNGSAKPPTTDPVVENEKRAPLSEREMMFLSREGILRFLNATKTGPEATIQRIERAIMWRRSARIEDVEGIAKLSEDEARMGKTIVMGYAPSGSPIMYFFPHRNTLPADQRKVVHALFMLERAIDLMSDGVTNVLVVFNFGGKRKGPPTSVAAARETLHILGEYYPELLGHAIIQEMPWVIRAFVAIMWPFVDPHTKSKIKFYSGEEAVAAGEVQGDIFLKECGGSLALPYDYDTYWPALIKTCLARRAEHLERWRALGEPRVGREERLYKFATPRATDVCN